MEERISIIIPVYNAEKYIRETVESVRRQTREDWELILVEDFSTDRTYEVLQELAAEFSDARIRIVRSVEGVSSKAQCPKVIAPAARARNRGMELAKGRYLAFLDADDLWKSEKLERTLSFLQEMGAGFVFTGYEFGDENAVGSGKIVRVPKTLNLKQALGNTTIFTSTVMVDTARIPKEQIFMPDIKSEDTATWWQILRTGALAYGLDENLVIYRRAGKSLSSNKMEALRRIWNLYRQAAGLSVLQSCGCFVMWAVRAVKRRI